MKHGLHILVEAARLIKNEGASKHPHLVEKEAPAIHLPPWSPGIN